MFVSKFPIGTTNISGSKKILQQTQLTKTSIYDETIKRAANPKTSRYFTFNENKYEEIYRGVHAWTPNIHTGFLSFTTTQKRMTNSSEKIFENFSNHPIILSQAKNTKTEEIVIAIRPCGSFYGKNKKTNTDEHNRFFYEKTPAKSPNKVGVEASTAVSKETRLYFLNQDKIVKIPQLLKETTTITGTPKEQTYLQSLNKTVAEQETILLGAIDSGIVAKTENTFIISTVEQHDNFKKIETWYRNNDKSAKMWERATIFHTRLRHLYANPELQSLYFPKFKLIIFFDGNPQNYAIEMKAFFGILEENLIMMEQLMKQTKDPKDERLYNVLYHNLYGNLKSLIPFLKKFEL